MTSSWAHLLFMLGPLIEAAIVLALSILPGWMFTKRLRQDPLARLLAAVLVSFTILYLLEFGTYAVAGPAWLPLAAVLLLAVVSLVRIVDRARAGDDDERFHWRGALAWLGLVSWVLALQSMIVAYGGANWFGDWYEHYERTIFFVDQLPPTTRFLLDIWTLPARGPVFNASAAVFLVLFGKAFWVYQIVATILNSFLVIPLALLVRDVGRVAESKAVLLSAVLLAVAPFAVTQETYTWTKFFTNGLFLAGVYFYLRSLEEDERQALGWSMGAFSLGVLSHYLTIPMAAPFGLHALYRVARKRLPAAALLYPTAACALLLATWFAYSVAVFGIHGTVSAHTAFKGDSLDFLATTEDGTRWTPAQDLFGNVVATLVPSGLRHEFPEVVQSSSAYAWPPESDPDLSPESRQARVREQWLADLVNNCDSLTGDLGFAGIASLLYIAWARGRTPKRDEPIAPPGSDAGLGPVFWLVSAGVAIVLFSWTAHAYYSHGLAHIGLQAYVLLLAVYMARDLGRAPAAVTRALGALFVLESAVTTSALLALDSRYLPIAVSAGGATPAQGIDANPMYVKNCVHKLENGATFLADLLGDLRWPFALLAAAAAVLLLVAASRAAVRRP